MKRGLSKTCYKFFSTLANPTRLAILELLRNGPKNVNENAEALKQEQNMISHNLKILERCKFLFSERKKRERFYYLNKETMESIFNVFIHHAEKYCLTDETCQSEGSLHKKKEEDSLSVVQPAF